MGSPVPGDYWYDSDTTQAYQSDGGGPLDEFIMVPIGPQWLAAHRTFRIKNAYYTRYYYRIASLTYPAVFAGGKGTSSWCVHVGCAAGAGWRRAGSRWRAGTWRASGLARVRGS